jgi:hypothetical protein
MSRNETLFTDEYEHLIEQRIRDSLSDNFKYIAEKFGKESIASSTPTLAYTQPFTCFDTNNTGTNTADAAVAFWHLREYRGLKTINPYYELIFGEPRGNGEGGSISGLIKFRYTPYHETEIDPQLPVFSNKVEQASLVADFSTTPDGHTIEKQDLSGRSDVEYIEWTSCLNFPHHVTDREVFMPTKWLAMNVHSSNRIAHTKLEASTEAVRLKFYSQENQSISWQRQIGYGLRYTVRVATIAK